MKVIGKLVGGVSSSTTFVMTLSSAGVPVPFFVKPLLNTEVFVPNTTTITLP